MISKLTQKLKVTKYKSLYLSFLFLIVLASCQQNNMQLPPIQDIAISWQMIANNGNSYSSSFLIVNQSDTLFPANNWGLYFNQLPRTIGDVQSDGLNIRRVNGDFFEISPTPAFKGLLPGDSVQITFTTPFWATKESDAPCGLYFAFNNGEILETVTNYTVLPFTEPKQFLRNANDKIYPPTAESIFTANSAIEHDSKEQMPPFLPTPKQFRYKKDSLEINANTTIVMADPLLENESNYLSNRLGSMLGNPPKIINDDTESNNKIVLSLRSKAIKGEETSAYTLDIDQKKGIIIEGTDEAGVFYGIQSLLQLIPPKAFSQKMPALALREISIKDAPAFSYRGMHVDVSRNFHTKEEVLKLLDVMALYKLNKFHFHLTDDEGWRLEISQLPELTSYGSQRGHTLDESEHLYPAYGSGAFNDYPGSGYYSREDFIEILKFAKERHIEVIPEIDMPGHARAAIKAMEYRFNQLIEEGDAVAAQAFYLSDQQDTSKYESVQGYDDNVICVCQESTYDFLEVVVSEMVSMYEAAGVKLKTVHTGGDEVPQGAWSASKQCQDLLASNDKYQEVSDLPAYFVERFNGILQKFGITTAGWEEIALKIEHTADGERKEINEAMLSKNLQPYVWNTVLGWGSEDLAYKLANAGFPVVMCNAPSLYFDFAYNGDPKEPGYYWGGLVDTRQVFRLAPYQLFLTAEQDIMGNEVSPQELMQGRTLLTKEGKENILGIQGQLWSETVKTPEMFDYYLFPKLIGLAQRAWEGQPDWLNERNPAKQESDFKEAFGMFSAQVGQQVFPMLDNIYEGVHYRIPIPGAKIENGILTANIQYPGLEIRYTTDGTEPNENSTLYTAPIAVSGNVQLKAFNSLGRSSLTSYVGEATATIEPK